MRINSELMDQEFTLEFRDSYLDFPFIEINKVRDFLIVLY